MDIYFARIAWRSKSRLEIDLVKCVKLNLSMLMLSKLFGIDFEYIYNLFEINLIFYIFLKLRIFII